MKRQMLPKFMMSCIAKKFFEIARSRENLAYRELMAYRSAHRLDFREKLSAYRRLLEVWKNLHIGSGSRERLRVLARGPLRSFEVFALNFGKMKRRDDLLEVAKISHIGVLRAGKRTNCARARSVEQVFKYSHSCRTSVRFFGNKKRAFALSYISIS
jgi:hypothetical protein